MRKLVCKLFGHRFEYKQEWAQIGAGNTAALRQWHECRCGHRLGYQQWLVGDRLQYPVYGSSGGLAIPYILEHPGDILPMTQWEPNSAAKAKIDAKANRVLGR